MILSEMEQKSPAGGLLINTQTDLSLSKISSGLTRVCRSGCPYCLFDPNVVVMQTTQERDRSDATYRLNRADDRCVFA